MSTSTESEAGQVYLDPTGEQSPHRDTPDTRIFHFEQWFDC